MELWGVQERDREVERTVIGVYFVSPVGSMVQKCRTVKAVYELRTKEANVELLGDVEIVDWQGDVREVLDGGRCGGVHGHVMEWLLCDS